MKILFFNIFYLIIASVKCSEWNYEDEGPDVWAHEFSACHGRLQSPINIEPSKAIFNKNLYAFKFNNYDHNIMWNISNNGHTIIANQIFDQRAQLIPSISGSDLKEEYYLQQYHFHWGFNSFQGSEHHINEEKFPLEIHMVHKSKSNKIAVLSILFQISEQDNCNLESLLKIVGVDIKEKDYHKTSLNLATMLNDIDQLNSKGYFRYMGSLTTPPCTEGVIWSIFNHKINISEDQMKYFHRNKIHFNYREVQSLNNRTLYTNVPTKSSELYARTNVENTANTPKLNQVKYFFILAFTNVLASTFSYYFMSQFF